MILKKFDADLAGDSPVWLINYSEYYLTEFREKYGELLKNIAGGFDDVPYRQGRHEFFSHVINVTDYEDIDKVPGDSILLIMDSYPSGRAGLIEKYPDITEKFSTVYFFSDDENETDLAYREKYRDTPLENIIVFRSGAGTSRYIPGSDFGDNARALFDYMLKEGYDEKYQLVWLVYDPARYERKYSGRNVRFLPYSAATTPDETPRDEYYRVICLAKWLFFTNSGVFCRNARGDQTRVQLWHGCGFKGMEASLIGRDEYKYEYMAVVSEFFAETHARAFKLRPDQLLVTGYPKDDLLYHPAPGWPGRFQIPDAKKYIFWLPTWRTTTLQGEIQGEVKNSATGLPVLSDRRMLEALDEVLRECDTVLVIKLHPWQDRNTLAALQLSHVILLENESLADEDIQINELLGYADALISDYSSVAVDYALFDRPMAFTLDDADGYGEGRGFHWPNIREYLPGKEIFSADDFFDFIRETAAGQDSSKEKRKRLRRLFHDFYDDKNSCRLLSRLGIEKG